MDRIRLQISRYGRSFLILIGLVVFGTACGVYILIYQRLNLPIVGASTFPINGAFPTAAAVAPGLGEPVNVAGVRVGQISGVSLKNGQGIVHMAIDPSKLPGGHFYRDASADLVPNTPLKDMQVNIHPGTPAAGILPSGSTISVSQSTSPIDSDELLAALDTDTRTWFTSLITDLNLGTTGRGEDLRALLNNLGPTLEQTRQIGDLLAARRHQLARLVHNLGVLSQAASQKDAQIQTVVRAGDATLQALASQDVALRDTIVRLPGTLQTTNKTLTDLIPFSNELGTTATALLPTARRLPHTLKGTETLFQGAALLPLKEIPPFVKAVLPLADQLPVLSRQLADVIPSLEASFKVLAYTTNETAYNPGGRNQGFLSWLGWMAHDLNSALSVADANGPAIRSVILTSCAAIRAAPIVGGLLQTLGGTTFGC
jgi:phospholipid/cholesterol/gamma-HCH transport system substrate-binding protein